MRISIRESHNGLVRSKNKGGLSEGYKVNKLLVSDTVLRYIIPINVNKFTPRYKQMCKYSVYIQAKEL